MIWLFIALLYLPGIPFQGKSISIDAAYQHCVNNSVDTHRIFDGLEVELKKSVTKTASKVVSVDHIFRQLNPSFQQLVQPDGGTTVVLANDHAFRVRTTNGEPFIINESDADEFCQRALKDIHNTARRPKVATTLWDLNFPNKDLFEAFKSCDEQLVDGAKVWTFEYETILKSGSETLPVVGQIEIFPDRNCMIKRVYCVVGDMDGKDLSNEKAISDHLQKHGNTTGVRFPIADMEISYSKFEDRWIPSEYIEKGVKIEIVSIAKYEGSKEDFTPAAFGIEDFVAQPTGKRRWHWILMAVLCVCALVYFWKK